MFLGFLIAFSFYLIRDVGEILQGWNPFFRKYCNDFFYKVFTCPACHSVYISVFTLDITIITLNFILTNLVLKLWHRI